MRSKIATMLLTGTVAASMLLAGCQNNENSEQATPTNSEQASATNTEQATAVSAEQDGPATIELEQTDFPLVNWKTDSSHIVTLKGKVLSGGNPVTGVEVDAGIRRITTDDNGSFEMQVDRSKAQTIPVSISNVEKASIAGQALDASSKEALKSATSRVDVYYPIEVSEVKEDPENPGQVEVHARAVVEDGQTYPKVIIDRYAIEGTVKDAKGNPVVGAWVTFIRDDGENFSRSQPSNEKGEYRMYYSPEDDEDLNLSVWVGKVQYKLPEGRVYRFPADTSVNTDIILPETGTTIIDKPPTLVSKAAPGALYWAQVIGLSVDPSVPYTVTMPTEDGSFVLKIAKAEWEKSPKFFQTIIRHFTVGEVKAGEVIPSDWITAPKESEPNAIEAQLN